MLGEHQASAITQEALRDLGLRAQRHGENAFTYGRLQGIEEALQGELASKDYRKAVGKVAKRRLKGWKQV